jgi:hypothetical protein
VNVVRQVFGVNMPAEITEAEAGAGEFTNLSELSVANPPTVFSYQVAARQAAEQATASHLTTFLPCGNPPSDACVEQFIRNRVARAFGRPLVDAEVQGLMAVYRAGAMDGPAVGVKLVIEATLQAPSFIYRSELGAPVTGGPTAKVKLTSHQLASALAFGLMDSVPDETLWQRAQDGTLLQPPVLAAEVDRLLAMPEVKANLAHKAGFWLGIEKMHRTEKDLTVFPEFTPAVKESLYKSAQLFVEDVFGSGRVSDLLTSRRMYLNETLARTYGIPGVTGPDFVATEVQLAERSGGILTQPAVLASHARPARGDPIHRGLFIYYGLVCGGQIPPPPKGALEKAATFPKDATERELSGFRAADPICRTCHSLFDPLGLSTERYDAIGRYRESDATGPIDSSSVLAGLGADLDGPVSGVLDLASRLQVGRRVSDCAATNLALFVLGREVKEDTSCALETVKNQFAQTGSFADFYRALATSPGFATRDVN